MTKIVEVRFDCEPHALTPHQVEGLLKEYDSDFDIDVGLGFEGKAATTFETADNLAKEMGERVAQTARDLGLTVLDIQVLSEEAYEQRAWNELGIDPNG
jgi:hypothetical protein